MRLTWRMGRDPAWRSWTLRSCGVVGVSEPFGRLDAVSWLLRKAWAVTLCHELHHGARRPPPGTFLPLWE